MMIFYKHYNNLERNFFYVHSYRINCRYSCHRPFICLLEISISNKEIIKTFKRNKMCSIALLKFLTIKYSIPNSATNLYVYYTSIFLNHLPILAWIHVTQKQLSFRSGYKINKQSHNKPNPQWNKLSVCPSYSVFTN